MTDSLLSTLLFALLCAGAGFAFGALISGLKAGKTGDPAPAGEHVELARLCRERGGGLLLQVKGQTFHSVTELTPGQRQNLGRLFEDWRLWLGAAPAVSTAPAAATGAEAAPAPAPTAAPALPPISPAAALPPLQPQPERSRPNPVDLLARALKTEVPAPEPLSIAAQVDEIVQEMLSDPSQSSAGLRSKGVRLMDLPGKGMVVMVGLEQYEGVEAVPDPEVQALLRAAVARWEQKMQL